MNWYVDQWGRYPELDEDHVIDTLGPFEDAPAAQAVAKMAKFGMWGTEWRVRCDGGKYIPDPRNDLIAEAYARWRHNIPRDLPLHEIDRHLRGAFQGAYENGYRFAPLVLAALSVAVDG